MSGAWLLFIFCPLTLKHKIHAWQHAGYQFHLLRTLAEKRIIRVNSCV